MPLFDSASNKIDTRLTKSNEYKQTKLKQLRDAVTELENAESVTEDMLLTLRQTCIDLLADEDFTYKRFTLFGTPSNCTKIANRIIQRIECQMGELLLLKLPEGGIDKKALMKQLQARNYAECLRMLDKKSGPAINVFKQWLNEKEKLPKVVIDSVASTEADPVQGWSEWDANQAVYDLESIRKVMERMPEGERVGFIYVIDEQGRPFFSLGTTEVSHCNILGDRKPCCGAGEVYITRNGASSLCVNVINNRSGLYRPNTSHHEPLKACFGHAEFSVRSTRFTDEAAKFEADLMAYKSMR